MAPSVFDKARGNTQMVAMNEIGYLPFNKPGRLPCLGTENFNSCTAVVIVSRNAAILAHIAPRPSLANADKATGDAFVNVKMNQVGAKLREHINDFKQAGGGLVAYAEYRGKVFSEDQKRIVEAHFVKWKLPFTSRSYPALDPGEPRQPGKGTVLVDNRGKETIVWVEDRAVAKVTSAGVSVTGSSAAGSSAAGPSSTV